MKRYLIRLTAVFCFTALCVTWSLARPKELIPGGCTVGIKLYSQGLVVTGFEKRSPAKKAGLKKGDVILQVDGQEVHTAEDLRQCLDDRVILTVLRDGKEAAVSVKPQETVDGKKLGTYIRNSMAGIGTVTYYDPNTGDFGALGHGVNDLDADAVLPVEAGVVVHSSVASVEKGKHGAPGQLKGKFDVNRILGEVDRNTTRGIFGKLTTPVPGKPLPVADPEDVKPGSVMILSNICGTDIEEFTAEIIKIDPHAEESGRNMLLQITDPRLLNETGGIVQGMSGSPIIQNGKIIGAVTHVLVNDPTRGYGISIEKMLEAAA